MSVRRPSGRPPAVAALAALGFLVLFGLPGATLAGGQGPAPSRVAVAGCAPATLTATPTTGPAPLLVNFSAQVSSSTAPTYAWTFGDGTYYNGSGALYASPVHRYSSPGTYSAMVTISSSSGSSVCQVSILATSAPFVAAIQAQPTAGVAPLNVTFTAQITGGSGTYLSAVWSFDDGDNGSGLQLTYTFVHAGHYRVLLNVTDSTGATARGATWVNVTADAVKSGPPPSAPSWWGGPVGIAVLAVVVAGLLVLAGVWMLGRRTSSAPRDPGSASPLPPGAAFDRPVLVATSPTGPAARAADGAVVPTGLGDPPREERTSTEIPPETLRLSQRVIVHLALQGALPDDAVATDGFTQGGMADALGVPQNRLSNVLRRLRDAGAITEDVRHVSGRGRRMKVYRLTLLGERLAQDLRRRAKSGASRRAPPRR